MKDQVTVDPLAVEDGLVRKDSHTSETTATRRDHQSPALSLQVWSGRKSRSQGEAGKGSLQVVEGRQSPIGNGSLPVVNSLRWIECCRNRRPPDAIVTGKHDLPG